MIDWGSRKRRIEPWGDFFLAAGYPVGVDIEQYLRGAVAEPVLGVFDAGAVFWNPAGMVMAHVVGKARRWRAFCGINTWGAKHRGLRILVLAFEF